MSWTGMFCPRSQVDYTDAAMVTSDNRNLVLLVDSLEASRDLYGHWLAIHDFGVLATPRGRVALSLLERYRPKYILVQDELPDMSSIDLLRQLKAQPSTAAVPVVMLSKSTDVKQHLWLAGASAVVPSLGGFHLLEIVIYQLERARSL